MTEPTIDVSEGLQVVDAAPKELTGKAAFQRDIDAVEKAIAQLKAIESADDDTIKTILALVQTKEHLTQLQVSSGGEVAIDISHL